MDPKIEKTRPSHTSLYIGANTEVQKVVNTYLVLHKVFFGLGIHIIVLVFSILISRYILGTTSEGKLVIGDNASYILEQDHLKTIRDSEEKKYINNDIQLLIQQGSLGIHEQILHSVDNLIAYKGYILPRNITLSLDTTLKKISYFNNSGYDLRFLDIYLDTIILSTNRNENNDFHNKDLLPLSTSILKNFGLQCLLSPKLINIFCEKAFYQAIAVLPLYDLQQDYHSLSLIYESIQGTEYEQSFCESIKKYIFFSNDSNKEIKEIMVKCGKQYEISISEFISFRGVQEQLSRESINSTVTSSRLLNVYKLLSAQNDIYYDIRVGKTINTARINGYNNYVESLIKTTDSIQGFYFDVIARYNNKFLIPELTKESILSRGEKPEEYKRIIEHMKKLNQGDSISKHDGLIKHMIKKDILESIHTTTSSGNNDIHTINIFKENYSFTNFVIKTLSGNNNSIIADGLLRFDNIGLANNSPMNVKFIYENSRFVVQSIILPRHKEIETVINRLLQTQKLTIGEVYNLIIDNSKLKETQDVCSIFKGNKTMTSCTPNKVVFNKQGIIYTFEYTIVDGVTNYTINNNTLYNAIVGIYGNKITITKNPVDAIKLILNYVITKETEIIAPTDQIGGAKEVQIQKDFNLIEAKISEISNTNTNNNSIVKFSLKEHKYIAVYDTNTKTIIGLGIIIGAKPQVIRNFTFSFRTAQPEEIELFKTDPASFLLQKDPLTVKKLQLQ